MQLGTLPQYDTELFDRQSVMQKQLLIALVQNIIE